MKKVSFLGLIIVLFLVVNSSTTEAQLINHNYEYRYYNTGNGLSQNSIFAIAQDSYGFMWFGTQEGLNRFDGRTFTVFKETKNEKSLKGNFINEILCDADGFLWIGTNKALCKFNPTNESFTSYFVNNSINEVNCIEIDGKNRLWLGTKKGLARFSERDSFPLIEALKNISILSLGINNDSLWIGSEQGLYLLLISNPHTTPKNHLLFYYDLQVEEKKQDTSAINVIFSDNNGYLRIGTESGNRYVLDRNKGSFINDFRYPAPITCMTIDFNNELRVGTSDISLKKNTANYKRTKKYNKGLSDKNILSLFNSDSAFWVGTFLGGINKLNGKKPDFEHYLYSLYENKDSSSLVFLSDNLIWSIHSNKDDLVYIGTDKGHLYKYDDSTGINIITSFDKTIYSIAETSDGVLCLGSNEVIYFFNSKNNIRDSIIIEGKIRSIKVDGQIIWAASSIGKLYKIENNNFKNPLSYSTKGLNGIYTINVGKIKPYLWIGTLENGLYCFNRETKKFNKVKEDVFNYSEVLTIVNDKSIDTTLWIGTSNGLLQYNYNKERDTLFVFNLNGIENQSVLGIMQDGYKNLWLSTTKGNVVNCVPDKHNVSVRFVFDRRDGLLKGEFAANSFAQRKNGQMFFGGTDGFNVFYPDDIKINMNPSRIYFTKLFLNNDEIKADSSLFGITNRDPKSEVQREICLSYNKDKWLIKIEFIALDYSIPERIHYYAKLYSYNDSIFYDLKNDNSILLSELDEGTYKLKVWSGNSYFENKNNDGNYVIFKINIETPFLKTSLGKSIIIICAFAVFLFFGMRWRYKKKTKKIEKKYNDEQISRKEENTRRAIEKKEKKIGIISNLNREKDISEISEIVISAILKIFEFDYSSVAIIDQFKNRISIKNTNTKNKNLVNPEAWKGEADYNLNEEDILCEVSRKRTRIIIIGTKVDFTKPEYKSINRQIFEAHNHKELNRIFIPILYSSKEKETVIGVIEAGFHSSNRKEITKEIETELVSFVNSCEPNFYRGYKNIQEEKIRELIENNSRRKNHNTFLLGIIRDIVDKFEVDFGGCSRLLFYNWQISYNEFSYEKNKQIIKRNNFVGQINNSAKGVVTQAIITNHYCVNTKKQDLNYEKESDLINSKLSVPLRHMGIAVGTIDIGSGQKDYFNEVKVGMIQEIADIITPLYIEKELIFAIEELTLPINVFLDIKKIYNEIIKKINSFFKADYITIWEQRKGAKSDDSIERGKVYEIVGSSKLYEEEYFNKMNRIYYDPTNGNKNVRFLIVNGNNHEKNNCKFQVFCRKNNFQTIIIAPLSFDNQIFGFINIYSKNDLPELFAEQITFLSTLSNKTAYAVSYAKLISSFKFITEKLTKRGSIFQTIADSAKDIMNADNVFLIKYDSRNKTFMRNVKVSGQLQDKYITERIHRTGIKNVAFLNYIIDNKRVTWNEDDYKKFMSERGQFENHHFRKSFWYNEGIKLMVGMSLEDQGIPIGVMIFNYKTEQEVSNVQQSFLNIFTSLANINLIVVKDIKIIKQQTKTLKKRKQQLEFEYEEVQNKMKEMLPLATRTSFYTILEGLNHDIRHILMGIKKSTLKIARKDYEVNSEDKKNVQDKILDIDRGIGLISNLLSLFRFSDFKIKSVDTYKVIRELFVFFRNKEDEEIVFDMEHLKKLPLIECVKAEFSMIFYNLLTNSVNAIYEKNIKGEITVSSYLKDNNCCFIVHDNGIGIRKEDIHKIYSPDFTSKDEGIGIGLFFVSETIENSFKGSITCESRYNEFTKFKIEIPQFINQ